MAKKPASKKSHTKPQPEPAQIRAVERLLTDGDAREAVRRIRGLLARFPDHGGLQRLLVEALERAEGTPAAALAAFAWAEGRPNSRPAQEALLHYATALGHLMLADRTADRVRELGGETRGFPLPPAMKATLLVMPDGRRTTADVMERFDIGKLHLEAKDFEGALRRFEDLDVPQARNNRALALFHLGRVDEALSAFLANWQTHPENLFALGHAVRLRLYQGDESGARGLCTPLAAAVADRPDDALAQMDALLLLRQDQAAWEVFERATQSGWFKSRVHRPDARLRHYGACAASRLGRAAEARRWWREALGLDADFRLASENLAELERGGKPPSCPVVTDLYQGLPITWVSRLRPDNPDPLAQLDSLTASNAYLEALYLGGETSVRGLVGFLLKRRIERGDADAPRVLRGLAASQAGARDERFGFLSFLQNKGLLTRGETVEYWDGDQLRQVRMTTTEIYREPAESDLPPALQEVLSEGIRLFNDRRLLDAEARFQEILRQVPDHAVALGNLAAVRSAQGRDEEAQALLRQVVTKHPDYLFARTNLANTLILKGELDEAEELLKGLAERERLRIQELFAVYGALAMLHQAKGDDDAAQSFLANLQGLVEDDDEHRLAQIKRALGRLSPGGRRQSALSELAKHVRAAGKRPR